MFIKRLKIESYKKGILYSSAFNVLAKGVAFFASIAVAYYFGTQVKTDVYFYCSGLLIIVGTYISSLDSAVIIPEAMRLAEQKSREDSQRFINIFLYAYACIGVCICGMLFINPVGIVSYLSRFSQPVLSAHYYILIFSVPLFLMIFIATFLVDIMTSYKYFTMPMIANMLNNVLALLFLCIFHGKLDIVSIMIGLCCGYILQIGFQLYVMKKMLHWDFTISSFRIEKRVLTNIVYSLLGNLTTALCGYIPLFLLSGYGAGIITALNYGQRTADLPTALITVQFSSVVGIKFNELNAKQNYAHLSVVFVSTAKLLLFILLPISAFVFLNSNELIALMFKRGAFNELSVIESANFLRYLSLLLPMLAINTLVARLFMAAQKVKQAFWYQIMLNAILIVLVLVCVSKYGPIGYPYALVILNVCNVFFIYYLLKYVFKMICYGEILGYFAKLTLLNFILFVMLFGLKICVAKINILLSLLLCFLSFLCALLYLNKKYSINADVSEYFELFKKRILSLNYFK